MTIRAYGSHFRGIGGIRWVLLGMLLSGAAVAAEDQKGFVACVDTWALPKYPRLAIQASLNASFSLRMKIGTEGEVVSLELISSSFPWTNPWGLFEFSVRESSGTFRAIPGCREQSLALRIDFQIVRDESKPSRLASPVLKSQSHIVVNALSIPPIP